MFSPLLAGIGDVIGALIPILVFVFWLIGQIAGNRQNAGPARPAVRRPPVPPVGDEAPAANEIQQFLRRASRPRSAPVEAEIVPPPRRAPLGAARPLGQLAQQPLDAEPVVELAQRHSVDSHVRQHLDISDYDQRADRLGDRVEAVDSEMQKHLKQTFDHRLGTLGDTSTAAAADAKSTAQTVSSGAAASATTTPIATGAGTTAAVDFAVLLSNAQNVRQAVILNEILQRPEDRWA